MIATFIAIFADDCHIHHYWVPPGTGARGGRVRPGRPLGWVRASGWDILRRRSCAPLWMGGAVAGWHPAPAHRWEPKPEGGFRVANIKTPVKRNKQNEKPR